MADIFLSYSRKDQTVARRFAERFEREGLSVWWDVTLRSGEEYDKVTENALNEAKAVVVLWSPDSVDSRWVRAEATQALRNGTLVPAMIGDCKRPIMFELTHTAELAHWQGDPEDRAWAAFLSDVRGFVAKDAPARPSPAPAQPAVAKSLSRKPLVAGGAALAVLAAIAIAAFMLVQPPATTPAAQRTAFFGFSADGQDPAVAAMAKSATDETFATFSAVGIDTASASETQNVESGAQLARARELGARYALGGEVRRDGDQFSVTLRLDDVQARTTLFQDTLTGGEAQKVSLPIKAAARATGAVGCYIETRTGLRIETDEILRAMKLVCAAMASGASFVETAERWRELARLAPDSASVQANRGLWLFLAIGYSPAVYQPAMRQEIDEALKHALAADPANFTARLVQANLSVADGGSLAEAEARYRAIRDADPNFFFLNMRYGIFLATVGRNRDALSYLRTGERLNPLIVGMRLTLALALANSGQPREAEQLFRHNDVRLPDDGENWSIWIQSALFDGAGDPREVLARAPPGVSPDALACMQEIVEGVLSGNAKVRAAAANRVIACESQGALFSTVYAIRPAVALGKLDEAFAFARKSINLKAYSLGNAVVLFTTTTRPMRADPRFLPFVKELGIYQYWLDTGTHPDVCELAEERDLPVCAELRAAQGGR